MVSSHLPPGDVAETLSARYKTWLQTVPATIVEDMLWRVRAYRLSLFVAELAWEDATILQRDHRTLGSSDQLMRAVGSIGANIAEGYGRSSGKDRARFYEYSLGSARESRDWYYKARHVLSDAVTAERLEIIEGITRLLLVMVPDQRSKAVHEDQEPYLFSVLDDV